MAVAFEKRAHAFGHCDHILVYTTQANWLYKNIVGLFVIIATSLGRQN